MFVESSQQSLADHIDEWLTSIRSSVANQTYSSYELLLEKHVRPRLGGLKLSEIRLSHVQSVYEGMLDAGRSPRTIQYVHSVTRRTFQKAIEQGKLLRNPCEFATLPKQRRTETKVMSPDEAKRFLEVSRSMSHGIIFELALNTGMRPEEYLALRWSDLDLENGVARVQRALVWNRKGGGFQMDETKTDKSRRSVPIPEELCSALRTHRRAQLEVRISLGPAYTNLDLVFATELGTPLSARNLAQRQYAAVLKDAGLENRGLVLYSLRHTCATLLLAAGENPKVVAERLGHTSVKMTLDTYSHVLPDMQKSATDRLAKMLYA